MRRLLLVVPVLLLSITAFAGTQDKAPGDFDGDRVAPRGQVMIVSTTHALSQNERAELAAKGLSIQQPTSGGRYFARVTNGAVRIEDERITAYEPLTPEKKIHHSALAQMGRGKTWANVVVHFHRDVPFEDARDAILDAGGALAEPLKVKFSALRRIEAKIAPASLDALAADDRVLIVAGRPRWNVESHNSNAAALSKVNEVQAAPYNLTGAGVTVSLFELAAAQASHPEFQGRLTVLATGGTSSDRTHATHVAGTIAAAGLSPLAKGMAPAVRIFQHCVRSGGNDCTNDWLSDKEDVLPGEEVRVDNNSWGYVVGWTEEDGFPVWLDADEYFGAYDLGVGAPLDEITIEKGILFVHSAGNDGDGTSFNNQFAEHRHVDDLGETITDQIFCYSVNGSGNDCPATCNGRNPATAQPAGCETVRHDPKLPFDTLGVTASAKNVIAVGSVGTNAGVPVISGFSSRGPAKDGRVKPDVVARGSLLNSTVPTNDYSRSSGTSMSSPVVTGIGALLVEQWRKTFGGADPSPAQLKALIIAGTDDLGNPGPDYTFGFGLVNAKKSVDLILADGGRGDRIRTFTFVEGQGQSFETPIVLPSPQNIRIVLHWADPAIIQTGPSDIAEKALVNDLDLKVVGPDGTQHLAWVLDKEQFQSNATRGRNSVDNLEMVEIANAPAGIYRIVTSSSGVTDGPQPAVLVTSALIGGSNCRDPQEPTVATNDTAATAYGNLVPGQTVSGAICTQSDVDFYKFNITKAGPATVTITTDDTPIRASLSGSTPVDIPANSTQTLTLPSFSVPLAVTLKIEANGTIGLDPGYTVVPQFGVATQKRRRSA